MQEEILTAEELAAKLKVSVPAVRLWTRQGLPTRPLGGRLVRFELGKALIWLEQRANGNGEQGERRGNARRLGQ